MVCRYVALLVVQRFAATAGVRSTRLARDECPYTELQDAKVQGTSSQIEATICGEKVTFGMTVPNPAAFHNVQWWDASVQGQDLSEEELQKLKDYLGSYHYARAVGTLGRGLLPALQSEDGGYTSFEDKDRASLVKSVLKFEVTLAHALNKLPQTKPAREVWRGSWIPHEKLEELKAALASGSPATFPWFQSTTVEESHSYEFMHGKNEPPNCRPNCIEKGIAYPVHFTFLTCRAKNVTEWNPGESEWLLMPNLRFSVVSIIEIQNDPMLEFDTNQMATWLEQNHTLTKFKHTEESFEGPWPALAAAVREKAMDGPAFVDWQEKNEFEGVELSYKEKVSLNQAMKRRYRLPPIEGMYWLLSPNQAKLAYNVTLKDSEPCDS